MITLVRQTTLQNLKNVRYKTDRKILEEIIRVDHAGELGADRIYAGQMAVLGQTSKGPLIRHMWDQEKHHRATFEGLIQKHRVRPTVMTPIWNIAGFVLGINLPADFFLNHIPKITDFIFRGRFSFAR